MPAPLTVRIDETNGRLSFSRTLILGSEYTLTFSGITQELEDGAVPMLVLFDCDNRAVAKSIGSEITLNSINFIRLFEGKSNTQITLHGYVYVGSTVLGVGMVFVHWSPLSFEWGDPVNIIGIGQLWASHTQNTQNPHNVTAEQVGAAPEQHEHTMADLSDFKVVLSLPDGSQAELKIIEEGGVILPYWVKL